MGFGFAHTISLRRYQPSACSAIARRAGIISRSLGFMPVTGGLPGLAFVFAWVMVFNPGWKPPLLSRTRCPLFPEEYESPQLTQSVPSWRSTRQTSRNTATMLAMYSSGVDSKPICESMRRAPQLQTLFPPRSARVVQEVHDVPIFPRPSNMGFTTE